MLDYPTTRIEPCRCGGRIRADRVSPAHGVAQHNRTRIHRAYLAAWAARLYEEAA